MSATGGLFVPFKSLALASRRVVPHRHHVRRASPLASPASRRHLNLAASPGGGFALYAQPVKRPKYVRWQEGVPERVKPTTSNLRPLERLSRRQQREGEAADPVTYALLQWDHEWRLYLDRFYTDGMFLRAELADSELKAIDGVRRLLELYSKDANAAIIANLDDEPAGARTPSGLSPAELNVWRLARRERVHNQVLRTLVDLMLGWAAVEKWRWTDSSAAATQPSTVKLSSGIILELPAVPPNLTDRQVEKQKHDLFLDFVDRIESFQKKYKSVGDGVKRLRKKVQRAGWKGASLAPAISPYTGDATPHPFALKEALVA